MAEDGVEPVEDPAGLTLTDRGVRLSVRTMKMLSRPKVRPGFTLIELIVVVLVLGVLAAFAIPQYLRSMEDSYAVDAAKDISALSRANQMYAADHNNTYATGLMTNACNTAPCTNSGAVCDLVACRYIAAQDWDSKPYSYSVAGPDVGSSGCPHGQPCCTTGNCAARNSNRSCWMSQDWAYSFDMKQGALTVTGHNSPPPPPSH